MKGSMLLEQRQRAETSPEQIVVPAPVDKSRPAPSGHPEHMPTCTCRACNVARNIN